MNEDEFEPLLKEAVEASDAITSSTDHLARMVRDARPRWMPKEQHDRFAEEVKSRLAQASIRIQIVALAINGGVPPERMAGASTPPGPDRALADIEGGVDEETDELEVYRTLRSQIAEAEAGESARFRMREQ